MTLLRPALARAGMDPGSDAYLRSTIDLMRDRVDRVEDFVTLSPYLFKDPETYDESARTKYWTPETPALMGTVRAALADQDPFDHAGIEAAVRASAQAAGVNASKLIHPLRLALSGMPIGPGLFELMALLGRDACLRRIDNALDRLSV